jgi:hypothetical protein
MQSELERCKAELGFNLISVGQPYIGSTALFEQVIQPYLSAGASTTSATAVTAASSPTPVTLTLTSGTGFSTGDRVVIDVDSRQETVTARLVSGVSLTADLQLAHTGTYQVTVEGGESIVRECLTRIRLVRDKMLTAFGAGALKRVDEVEFWGTGSLSFYGQLGQDLMAEREYLASVLGIQSRWSQRRAGAQRLSVY